MGVAKVSNRDGSFWTLCLERIKMSKKNRPYWTLTIGKKEEEIYEEQIC